MTKNKTLKFDPIFVDKSLDNKRSIRWIANHYGVDHATLIYHLKKMGYVVDRSARLKKLDWVYSNE